MLLLPMPRPAIALVVAAVFALACVDPNSEATRESETESTGDGDGDENGDGDGDADAAGDGDGGGDGEPTREGLIAELEARGPYAIGFKQIEVSYSPPGSREQRVLPVNVWYPAVPESNAPQASYSLAGIVPLPSMGILAGPKVAAGGPFPVAIYSHGSGGENILAYPYAERFASHGWIVFAPNHVGNTTFDSFNETEAPFIVSAVNRPNDISAVLDAAAQGFGGDLGTSADLSQVFVFGHSFGGYTSLAIGGATLDYQAQLAVCEGLDCDYLEQPEIAAEFANGFGDPRVGAIASQAPALIPAFGAGEIAGIGVPTLLQSGKLDITTPDATQAQPAWNALSNLRDLWTDLPFGAHYSFITICDVLEPELLALFEPNNVNDGCGPGFTPTTEIIPVLTTYLLAFARLEVLDEARWKVILTGEPLHSEVELTRH